MSSAQSQRSFEELDCGLPRRHAAGNSASTPENPSAFTVGLHLGEQLKVAPRPTVLQVNPDE